MQRFYLILVFSFNFILLYSQNTHDTIVITDTVKKTKTIIAYDFSHPTHYNVFGFQQASSLFVFREKHHDNSISYMVPEIFCNFSRNTSLFSVSARYAKFTERLEYSINHQIITEFSKTILDTVSWYREVIGFDTTIYYITKEKQVQDFDTSSVDSIRKFAQNIQSISFPIRYGYYITKGYWRYNFGIGITPTMVINTTKLDNLFVLQKTNKYNMYVEPTFEVTYWLFDKIFFHSKIAYSHSVKPYKSVEKANVYLSNIYVGIGVSYLFYDKMWE